MVVETIHVMDAEETTSQAFKNYAGAAFLLGMGILYAGIGVGIISASVKNMRKQSSSLTDDILAELRKNSAGRKVSDVADLTKNVAVESLRKTVEDIIGGTGSTVADQKTSKFPTLYYVKKAYKEPVVIGSLIPANCLVVKPETMTMETFMKMDNLKFKSKTTTHIKGGIDLITVDEILNSEPVKPV